MEHLNSSARNRLDGDNIDVSALRRCRRARCSRTWQGMQSVTKKGFALRSSRWDDQSPTHPARPADARRAGRRVRRFIDSQMRGVAIDPLKV